MDENWLENIRPIAERFEQERIAIKHQRSKQILLAILIFLVALALGLIAGTQASDMPLAGIIIFIIGAIIALIVGSLGSSRKSDYISEYKRQVFGAITQAVAPGMSYRPDFVISEQYYEEAGLASTSYDRYSGEDLFEGTVGDTAICFSELHVEDRRTRTDAKGNTTTHWETVFRGILFVADFHKNFTHEVLLEPDIAEASFGWLGRKIQNLSGDVTRFENSEFEKAFKVSASDPVESRYLLTPDMQSRFLSLYHAWHKPLSARLSGSCLFIALPSNENWFEMNFGYPANDRETLQKFHHQLTWMLGIVDGLNLNTRIWTKE